jgi:hypothetical protein
VQRYAFFVRIFPYLWREFKKRNVMPQVREKEVATYQEKYFDLIKNDENLCMVNTVNDTTKKHKTPDEDFYRAITIDELREKMHQRIHELFANK